MNLIAFVLQNKKKELLEKIIKEDVAIEINYIKDIGDLINILHNEYIDYSIERFSDKGISGIARSISNGNPVCITLDRKEIFNGHYKINLYWGGKDIYEFDEYEIVKVDEILWT